MNILLKNARIMENPSKEIYEGEVFISDGKIEYTGKKQNKDYNADRVIDCEKNLLMSGFCNAHSHSAMTLFRGYADDLPLKEWLFDKIFPLEDNLTEEDIYWGTMLAVAEYVKNGITAIADMYFFDDTIVKAIKKSGICLALCSGKNDLDGNTKKAKDYIENAYLKYKDYNRCKYIMGLHAEYTCSEELIKEVADLSIKYNAPTCIHLSETLNEVGECTVKRGLTPPQYLHKIGFFDNGGIVAHGTYLDKDDIAILKDKNVTVVTNPSSNLKLASGVAPVYTMKENGLNIAIGTDGAASNNSLSMFKEMYLTSCLQKERMKDASVISAEDTLSFATINGYKALGFNGGEIKKGRDADIILINLNAPNMQPLNNIKKHLVYSADSSNVMMTIAGGNICYENGKYNIGEDIQTIYKNAERCIKNLINKAKK